MTAAFIPYGQYWSTPFARWQGSLAHLHSLEFAAWNGKRELQRRGLAQAPIDYAVLGLSVPQQGSFYGVPWAMGLMGFEGVGGPTVAQACATSARCLAMAADEVAAGRAECSFVLTADRVSNGPQIYYPDPNGPGGSGKFENWVLDNFKQDPFAKVAMIETGENAARRHGIATAEQNEATLLRYEQYRDALADDQAFQRRYMSLPFDVPDARLRKTVAQLSGDEGIHATTREGLARLEPVLPGGTITFGGQTHPADAMRRCSSAPRTRRASCPPGRRSACRCWGSARPGWRRRTCRSRRCRRAAPPCATRGSRWSR